MPGSSRPILLVEDSDEDYGVIQWAWKKAGVPNPLFRCRNGEEALDWLHRRGEYTGVKTAAPAFILLDLNLPRKTGQEVLVEIKNTQHLKATPVVILTTSSSPKDVTHCYDNGANSYLLKPLNLNLLLEMVAAVVHYWTRIVYLPFPE